jgi:hypothetical protein
MGALLIAVLKTSFEPLFLIFIIGTLVRMVIVYIFLPKFKEVRQTRKAKPKEIRDMILKEMKPTLVQETHQLLSIKKYFSQ